jgi:type I restriction enzyme, S subunit
MKADFMCDTVSRFGDDPEGIGHFRKVVIGLAIAGKLVGEGQPLSPAEMLDQIENEKVRLLRGGKISKPKRFASVIDDQLPEAFADPSAFAPLGAVARIEKGLTGIQGAKSGSFPLVVTAAERGSCDHFDFDGAATIVPLVSSTGHGNASINRLHYQEGRFALGTILAAIFPYAPDLISARFIFEYLSTFKDELLVSRMTGTANVTLSIGRIAEVPIPLICPTVQRRADELMTLCDQLEAARTEREAARDTFTQSTLAKLNTPDTDTFGQDARFALANLAPLTTRPDQIKQLRQTILNLAVRGKLIEQDAADENARNLKTRIATARAERAKAAGVRAKRPISFSGEAAMERLPENWTYEVLGNLVDPCATISYGVLVPGPDCDDGIPFVRAQDLSLTGHATRPNKTISPEIEAPYARTRLKGGEILLCVVGSIGKIGIVPASWAGANIARAVARISPVDLISSAYVLLAMRSEWVQQRFSDATRTLAQPTLNVGLIEAVPIPIPPLAEQHRIVAKVDELMALCDQLEASLTTAEQTRSRLLEAVLHNALEPA